MQTVIDNDKTLAFYDIVDGAVNHVWVRHHGSSVRTNRLAIKSGQITCFMAMWKRGDVIEFIRGRVARKSGLLAPGLIVLSNSSGR